VPRVVEVIATEASEDMVGGWEGVNLGKQDAKMLEKGFRKSFGSLRIDSRSWLG